MTASALDAAHETTRRITALSVATAVLLIVMKAFALGASGSVSILASLADSALDLVASLATFFAVRWAAASPDEEHRYGHGKAEGLASLVQSGMVLASGVFIGWEALQRIFDPRPVTSGGWAVGVVLLSIAITAGLVWMQTQAMKKTGSLAVAGDRAHYAADLAANVVVLIGVVAGAFLRAPGLDAAAGLVVAVWLAWGAVSLLKDAAGHLLDRAAPDADRAAIVAAVGEDARITNVHQLRTRMAGQALMVQMHVDLDPDLSLKAAHDIVLEAEKRVLKAFPHADILIHADPRGAAEPHGGAFASARPTAPDKPVEAVAPEAPAARPGPWS
ncbi:cation transporter [Brevundimonas naejangsanensis]|uniref:Cation transporter n=1 Tax=Brevundimonas naejangsanensis TaxID=588932 RepID=A0A494RFZ5_9CAUL|nr:cation diffusion facilitator family transporter [Brevundimonas naejangsanensis]AYG94359.1 cation transporter [Brevundimonas naejangsanensis]